VAGAGLAPGAVHGGERPGTAKNPKIRVGVIGCGNVSGAYLADLAPRSFVELVSVCDIIVARAEAAAKQFHVPHFYPHIDKMLAGAEFELLVNLTSMPAHFPLNQRALAAGKHVWCENGNTTPWISLATRASCTSAAMTGGRTA